MGGVGKDLKWNCISCLQLRAINASKISVWLLGLTVSRIEKIINKQAEKVRCQSCLLLLNVIKIETLIARFSQPKLYCNPTALKCPYKNYEVP